MALHDLTKSRIMLLGIFIVVFFVKIFLHFGEFRVF